LSVVEVVQERDDRRDPALPPARSAPPAITLWHHQGIPARVLAERAGHSRASMSLDVYSHVMPLGEIPDEHLLSLLRR
jgi:hypothetical protein